MPSDDKSSPRPAAFGMMEMLRVWKGNWARLGGAQSPTAAALAWTEFCFRLAGSPSHLMQVAADTLDAGKAMAGRLCRPGRKDWVFRPDEDDRRFRYPGWSRFPFSLFAQAQLAAEALWRETALGTAGLGPVEARRVEFLGRFALNAIAPVNFPWTNPEIVDACLESFGANLVKGQQLLAEDVERLTLRERLPGLEDYVPGKTVAVQPGRVVYRNALMEIIQYAPSTETVWRQPVLIVPAWLMKFYILDLTPRDSLIHYLVGRGHTVFVVSWKNPGADMASVTFDDYRRDGVMVAIDIVEAIVPGQKIQIVGYCLGGTVVAIAAAAMADQRDDRLASVTLLAAQTDFSEVGDMMLFVDESQVRLLEDLMHVQGFLDTRQMSTAFYALRTNEMVFARMVERYLLGRAVAPADIDAWLADPTRIPERTHSDYLRRLFLDNSFARGAYQVDGRPVGPADIDLPVFLLGAERDHVAPWRSVFRTAFAISGPATFVLTGGGHNTGIVSPPDKPKASFRRFVRASSARPPEPDAWAEKAVREPGSWWPAWVDWLEAHSSPLRGPAPPMGTVRRGLPPLEPAPGHYVAET